MLSFEQSQPMVGPFELHTLSQLCSICSWGRDEKPGYKAIVAHVPTFVYIYNVHMYMYCTQEKMCQIIPNDLRQEGSALKL